MGFDLVSGKRAQGELGFYPWKEWTHNTLPIVGYVQNIGYNMNKCHVNWVSQPWLPIPLKI